MTLYDRCPKIFETFKVLLARLLTNDSVIMEVATHRKHGEKDPVVLAVENFKLFKSRNFHNFFEINAALWKLLIKLFEVIGLYRQTFDKKVGQWQKLKLKLLARRPHDTDLLMLSRHYKPTRWLNEVWDSTGRVDIESNHGGLVLRNQRFQAKCGHQITSRVSIEWHLQVVILLGVWVHHGSDEPGSHSESGLEVIKLVSISIFGVFRNLSAHY